MAGPAWDDLEVYGRRNNKIIKYMETRLFKTKTDDPDTIVHYATAIGNLTRQNIEIIKIKTNYDSIISWFSTLKQDENAIKKHRLRENNKTIQQQKQEMQNQKDVEIEEEKSVRIQMKMKKTQEIKL